MYSFIEIDQGHHVPSLVHAVDYPANQLWTGDN